MNFRDENPQSPLSDQTVFIGEGYRFQAAVNVELVENVLNVVSRR